MAAAAYYADIKIRGHGLPDEDIYFPTVKVEAIPKEQVCDPRKAGCVDYCYALFDGGSQEMMPTLDDEEPSPPHDAHPQAESPSPRQKRKVYSVYAEVPSARLGSASSRMLSDDDDESDEGDDEGNYYVPDTSAVNHDDDDEDEDSSYRKPPQFSPYSRSLELHPESDTTPGGGEMEWTLLEPSTTPKKADDKEPTYDDPEVYRVLANVDAELVKAALRRYAESMPPDQGHALLQIVLQHANEIQKERAALVPSYDTPVAQAQYWSLSGQGGKSVSASPLVRSQPKSKAKALVDKVNITHKSSLVSLKAPIVEKNTKWNESYQDIIATGIKNMSLEDVEKLLRLANDFVYTCMTYTKIIVNELNMPNERKTIKPATNIGGLAGGEKYVVQGILFKFCLDPQVSTKGKGVWLYGGSKPSEEKAAKAAALELQGLSLLSSLFMPDLHLPLMALIDFKGFRILATSLLPISKETIIYGSHDAGKSVHASDTVFNQYAIDSKKPSLRDKMMDQIGTLLNLKKHTVGKKRVPIVGPGDIEGHKALDGRYYLLDYARLMPAQAPIPGEDGKWDGREVFYQMLRPEFVRSYKTPLSSDVFTGWSIHDQEREKSELEVIEATRVLINERIPALAKELDAIRTEDFQEVYSRSIKEELDPNKIIRFLTLVNLESRMHAAGINIRHMGRLRQLVSNTSMRHFILCAAVSRTLKHKLRNKMRKAVREKRQGDLASEVSCKRVIAKVLNKIIGSHEKSGEFWHRSVVKSLRKRFPLLLTPEEQQESYDIKSQVCLRVVVAILMTMNMVRLTQDASDAIFRDLTTVRLVSSDVEAVWIQMRFDPVINLLDAERNLRLSEEEKNKGLRKRLLESARTKLNQAINALPYCAYSHWTVARVELEIVRELPYDLVAEHLYKSIYQHLHCSLEMEKARGTMITWAEALEEQAAKLEEAGRHDQAAVLRQQAAEKNAIAPSLPVHPCQCDAPPQ